MHNTRIYLDNPLASGELCTITNETAHHISRVLRMRTGQDLILFNGKGGEFEGAIVNIDKRHVEIEVGDYIDINRESIIDITLVQGIPRGQRMDYTIQKAVELGANKIVPVLTEFGTVHLDSQRLKKRVDHWQKIIINTCEQCGRNLLPSILTIPTLEDWITQDKNELKLVLNPDSGVRLSELTVLDNGFTVLIGSEGGFSDRELELAQKNCFLAIKFGPRILRTETAAVAAITACQTLWGDIS